ncbi:hypothetical protein AB0F81_22035 [Actinoplanes sp. NPDC024001]|uniref:hypothetical protein n=1 Tax=Actinoplanes sp. NPDC024001 TaxID=3154598 RepID=UPI0033FE3EB0
MWSNGQAERWKFANLATLTQLTLASHPTATVGWGWGSTKGFNYGVSTRAIFESNMPPLSGRWQQNNWGTIIGGDSTQLQVSANGSIPAKLCNDNCIDISTPPKGPDDLGNKAYIGGTGTDRKMFYNHELRKVYAADCPVRGHLKAGLQIIDDTGAFRGLIMVEASLADKTYGTNILTIFDLNNVV